MVQPEPRRFADHGRFPNSRWPVLVYRAVLSADPAAMERAFAANGWFNGWRNGIFTFHHFHSIAHEVLGIAAGTVQVLFGGPAGETVTLRAGDVAAIPAGVAHRNVGQSADLLVVGAYPGGARYDTCRGEPGEQNRVRRNIAAVPVPETDPVLGPDGPLCRAWHAR